MDELHPFRIWQLERDLKPQLAALRAIYERGRKQYGEPKDGVLLYEAPVQVNPNLVHSFEQLQVYIAKQSYDQQFLQHFLGFWDETRQVFSMQSSLCEQLAETDIGDVPWSELHMPHGEFYLSFGEYGQDWFGLRSNRYIIDGVYLKHVAANSALFSNDTLLMHFTSRLIHPSYGEAKRAGAIESFHFSEPVYQFCVSGEGCKTIGEAIAKGEAEYRAYCARMDDCSYKMAQEFGEELGLSFGPKANYTAQRFERGKQVILPAVPLLFNSLFYLTQMPEARSEGFPKSAPIRLVQDWKSTVTPSIKKSLEGSLARKGFSKVYFIHDAESDERLFESETTRKIRSHWRRGHWRRQQFGKGNLERKWLWIRPVLVKKEEPFTLGTVHVVKPQEPPES